MDSRFAKDRAAAAVVAGAAVAAFNVNAGMNGTKAPAVEIGANQHPHIGNNRQDGEEQNDTSNAVANSANYFASKNGDEDGEELKGEEKYGKIEDEEAVMGSESASVISSMNDKRYTCETCKQTFTRKHNLKSHVLIHTSDKPFKCTDCGITFRRGYDLKRHMKTHTKEKPFHCKHCGKGFARADALLRHTNSSSGCGNAASASDMQSEKDSVAHDDDDSEEHILKRPKIQFQDPVIPVAESRNESAIDASLVASAIDAVSHHSRSSSSASSSKFAASKNSSVDSVYDTLHSLLGNIERAGVDQITSDAMLKLTDVLLGLDERIKILNRRLDQLPTHHHQ